MLWYNVNDVTQPLEANHLDIQRTKVARTARDFNCLKMLYNAYQNLFADEPIPEEAINASRLSEALGKIAASEDLTQQPRLSTFVHYSLWRNRVTGPKEQRDFDCKFGLMPQL